MGKNGQFDDRPFWKDFVIGRMGGSSDNLPVPFFIDSGDLDVWVTSFGN